MHIQPTELDGVLVLTPRRFDDARGSFSETYNKAQFAAIGIAIDFVQDNHSISRQAGTIRGLHYQTPPNAQAKLVRAVRGKIYDVAVDIRAGSPTFGRYVGVELSAENGKQLLVPAGYAHGFCTLVDDSEVIYKVDAYYDPACDSAVAWNDKDIGIDWPLNGRTATLSDKDARAPGLSAYDNVFQYQPGA